MAVRTEDHRRNRVGHHRDHPSPRSMAQLRGCRIRNPRMARFDQQPPPARANCECPSRRSLSKLLRGSGNRSHCRVTNVNQPSANPARFKRSAVVPIACVRCGFRAVAVLPAHLRTGIPRNLRRFVDLLLTRRARNRIPHKISLAGF